MTAHRDPALMPKDLVATGVPGLDAILHGGYVGNGIYLISGPSGTGKSTLGLQFLLQGVAEGESVLYVTLSQQETSLRRIARSHGWSLGQVHLEGLEVHDVTPGSGAQQTVLHTHEVELPETVASFEAAVDRVRPSRVVFDSLSELRLLAGDPFRYRREILRMRAFLADRACTALLLHPSAKESGSDPVEDLVDGVIRLQQTTPPHGGVQRRLLVVKTRGAAFSSGYHDMAIRTGGLTVFPRLQVGGRGKRQPFAELSERMASGVPGLDEALDGGLERGSSCLILGPTGVGKTSLATSHAHAALERGERAAIFLFEERPASFLERSRNLNMDVDEHVRSGRLALRLIDTGELSPGEFAHDVLRAADEGAGVVVLDSLTGYGHAMRDHTLMVSQLDELLDNLADRDVLTLLTVAQHGIVGTGLQGPDISYLADTLVMLRHFEDRGALRKALAIVKRRQGRADTTLREVRFENTGPRLGEALTHLTGIVTGIPRYVQDPESLLAGPDG